MDRLKRASKTDEQDQYVLTVFLPLLAIAILACAGGCCYMERRRKRRKKKNGGVDPQQILQDEDDTASVISTNSTRRRHYLMPTPTTGRLVRGASVRSNYSSYGEPLYDTHKKENNGDQYFMDLNNTNAAHQPRSNYNYNKFQRVSGRQDNTDSRYAPLARSRSMVDVRRDGSYFAGHHNAAYSSNKYLNDHRQKYEDENLYESLRAGRSTEKEKRSASPTHSEWSVRTAPPRTTYEPYQGGLVSRPSSRASSAINGSYAGYQREHHKNRTTSNMKRSSSQPNLHSMAQMTHPYGIPKSYQFSEEQQPSSSVDHYSLDMLPDEDLKNISTVRNSASRKQDFMGLQNGVRRQNGTDSIFPQRTSYYPNATNGRQNYSSYVQPGYGDYTNRNAKVYSVTSNGYQLPRNGLEYMYSQHYGQFGDYA